MGLDTPPGVESKPRQAALLVKGRLAVPDSMLRTDARKTTESLVRWTELQTWQVGLSHSGASRLEMVRR